MTTNTIIRLMTEGYVLFSPESSDDTTWSQVRTSSRQWAQHLNQYKKELKESPLEDVFNSQLDLGGSEQLVFVQDKQRQMRVNSEASMANIPPMFRPAIQHAFKVLRDIQHQLLGTDR